MNSNEEKIARLIGPKKHSEATTLLDGNQKVVKKDSIIKKNLEYHYNDSAVQLATSKKILMTTSYR